MKKRLEILSSFIAGFGKRSDSDVINGLFIAVLKLRERTSYTFENRGCLGVESREIRRILNFNGPLEITKNHREFMQAGHSLSSVSSDELGWIAQYLMNGKTHLYPSEAKKALEVDKSLALPTP